MGHDLDGLVLVFSLAHCHSNPVASKSQVMGSPPAEEREVSIKAIGVDDIFGCGMRPQQMLHLAEMEAEQEDKLLVILSDVQRDKPLVGTGVLVLVFASILTLVP